ncbi:MAG TPA: DUF4238 domain-containing protein [Candidatus Acidoferrales bacterium]|nr:DUF4238 domain-containing protein [Candidatus Acidoferrales bacterium]
MRNDGKAELQHYVPRLLLRFHVNNPSSRKGTEQVWCFDKLTDRVFSPNIANILAGTRFNEIEIDGHLVSLEESLAQIEHQVSPILARIVDTRTLHDLTDAERQAVASFCSVQLVRTQGFRQQMRDTHGAVLDALKKRGLDISQQPNLAMPSEEEIKISSFRMLIDAPQTYGPHFLAKHWHLIGSTVEDPFHLGDHPVVVDSNSSITGHLESGLSSPGVSIYLPLCPTLCLAMSDQILVSSLFEGAGAVILRYREIVKAMSRRQLTPEIVADFKATKKTRDDTIREVRPMQLGIPSPYNRQVTLRANSLQMFYASRWIVSSQSDFSTPKMMIADSEEFRTRPKVRAE